MQHVIILPDLGQTTNEAKVLKWLKWPGEKVARGEPLLAVETDKVNMEVESFVDGYLREIIVGECAVATALKPVAILTDGPDDSYIRPAEALPAAIPGNPAPRSRADAAPQYSAQQMTSASASKTPAEGPGVDPRILTNDRRVQMFRQMLLCRLFEDRVYNLFLQGKMPGTIHQAQGQEACAVGVCAALRAGDMITSTHRPPSPAACR